MATTVVGLVGIAVFASAIATLVPFLVLRGVGVAAAQTVPMRGSREPSCANARGTRSGSNRPSGAQASVCWPGLRCRVSESLGWRSLYILSARLGLVLLHLVGKEADADLSAGPGHPRDVGARGGDLSYRPLVAFGVAGALASMPQGAFVTFAVTGAVATGLTAGSAGLLFAAGCALGWPLACGWYASRIAEAAARWCRSVGCWR